MNTENNKLIADFMGLKLAESQTQYDKYVENGFLDTVWHASEVCYNSSWEWLMPVVEKIEQTNRVKENEYCPYAVTICKNGCTISDGNNGSKVVQAMGGQKLGSVYTAVVLFIDWYNKNK